jgi:hypothetical protein
MTSSGQPAGAAYPEPPRDEAGQAEPVGLGRIARE